MDTLPEISLGTAALIIFALCACYMFLRGLARTIVNVACLTLSAWVGFRVWQQAPSLSVNWIGKTSDLVSTGLPIVAFLVTLLVFRKIIGFFRAPLGKHSEDSAPRSMGQVVFRLLITIIPAALLFLTAATFIHHASAIAEIRDSADYSTSSPSDPGLGERMKKALSLAVPERLMSWLDPLTTEPRIQLAKMIAASPDKPLSPIVDPETGRPYPRAIIVDDPELVKLAHEGQFSTLLHHPLLSKALEDSLIRQSLGMD